MNKKVNLFFAFLIAGLSVFAQEALNTNNGVKTSVNFYEGGLNTNQSWGGTGMAGMYIFNARTTVNAPTSSDWYHVIEMQHDQGNNWTGQVALGYFTDGMYYRQQYGNNWGNWHTLASQDWVQSLFNTRLTLQGSGAAKNVTGDINGDLVIRSNTGGRDSEKGAMLEFVIPANTDGSNPWGQARILTVAGNGENGNATGKMMLVTRRLINKTGAGQAWYYGEDITIAGNGYVGIGTTSPKEILSVNGNIRAKEIKVETANWPDYVFSADYQLASLDTLESYINTHKHLPEMPSAQKIQQDGLTLGEMVKMQQQKIEELTLYLIEQNRVLREQQKQLKQLQEMKKRKTNQKQP